MSPHYAINKFFEQIKNLFFYLQKKIQAFQTYIYRVIRIFNTEFSQNLLHGCNIQPKGVKRKNDKQARYFALDK